MKISVEMSPAEIATVAGALSTGGLGGALGSHMSIAVLGTAIAGTVPLAIVGALLGGLIVNKAMSKYIRKP